MRALLLLAFQIILSGCAPIKPTIDAAVAGRDSHELVATPFFPQEQFQCGPAALATVLTAAGHETTPAELKPTVFTPGRRGTLQHDLIGATRRAGLLPYQIDGTFDGLLSVVEAGQPVLVLQNLGIGWWSQWHYSVVVGFDVERRRIILRSGTDQRRATRMDAFINTWARADFWGLVVSPPEQMPAGVDQQRYFQAVAAIEAIGETDTAKRYWNAAADRWPDHPVPILGQANAFLAQQNYRQAERLFRELRLRGQFRSVVTNNLAFTIAQRGEFEEALQLLDTEIAAPEDRELVPTLNETRKEILGLQRAASRLRMNDSTRP